MKQDSSSGYAALRHGAAVVDRSSIGVIELKGADRLAYLQGLLTNDVTGLRPGDRLYAAMLTAQGRMITDMTVFAFADRVLLEVPGPLTAKIAEHLDRFVFSEDVQVADLSGSHGVVGIYGPEAEATAARVAVAGELLGSDAFGVSGVDIVIERNAGNGGNDGGIERTIRALVAAGALEAAGEDVEVVRVESGFPLFGQDMTAETIPLEAGIEDRAISRTKGCYVGQEVIVRVLDRGHGRVAKRLVGLAFETGSPVPIADVEIASGDRIVGRVTSAVLSPALGCPIALGYLQRDFAAAGTVVEVEGRSASVRALPFVPS